MSRPIDADALLVWLNNYAQNDRFPVEGIVEMIERMPTIEPETEEEAYERGYTAGQMAQRKKGKWIHGRELSREMIGDVVTAIFYEGWECSACGCVIEDDEPTWNFCPNCGADMRGDQNEQID